MGIVMPNGECSMLNAQCSMMNAMNDECQKCQEQPMPGKPNPDAGLAFNTTLGIHDIQHQE
jgi:hypothetical protein